MYLEHLRAQGKSPHTIVNYKVDLTHFKDYLFAQGITDVGAIDLMSIRVFLSSILGVGEAKTSAARRLSAIRGFTSWLRDMGYAESDPSVGLKGPKKNDSIPRALSYEQTMKLMTDGLDEKSKTYRRDRLLMEMMYSSGLRVSEVIGLNWDSVEIEERCFRVLGKGDKERFVPFGEPLRDMLREWRDLTCVDEHAPVFSSGKGAERLTVRTVDRVVLRAAARAGLYGVTPHTLRHCCATHMLENGAPLRIVQEMLGHESIAATQRYLMITSDQIKKMYLEAHPMASDTDNGSAL
ncbi:MAG: tyrosine-type recombinase/integrase [Synergistes sp.]|nr:tyrosine-type recombinase/integrase [Synergistes sp.]